MNGVRVPSAASAPAAVAHVIDGAVDALELFALPLQ